MMGASGQCLCGAIAFSVEFPTNWVAHCHCTQCQRAHGAAFVTWVSAAQSQVAIRDQDGLLSWHSSSPSAQRGFCSRCGSSLFFRSTNWPGELHISRANFNTPLDKEPQAHGYYDTHVDWITLADTLPKKPAPDA